MPNDDFSLPGGTRYETLVQDQNSNFLKFSIFLPPTSNNPLYSLSDLQQYINENQAVRLSSSSLNNPSPPSSGGIQPIRLTEVPEPPTDVPENPMSILLGTGLLSSVLFLKRMKRSS